MHPIFFILLQFLSISNAQDHIFIRDYFLYKKVRNVVGFSCGDIISMYLLLYLIELRQIYI